MSWPVMSRAGGNAHMPSGIPPSSEVSAVVLRAFERAPGPLTLAALKKALTKPFQAQGILSEALSGLMAEGRIHRWPGTVKSEKYWVHEPGVFTRGKIVEALRPGPRSASEISRELKALGLTTKALDVPLKELVGSGQVYLRLPPKGSTLRFALQPPPPHELLKKTLKAFQAESLALAKRGFRQDQLDDAARRLLGGTNAQEPSDDGLDETPRRLLRIMRLAASGGVIPLRELRRLTFIAKPEFDAAILALRDAGRVHLHHHDHPVGIAEDERYDLVTDNRGHYYVAAGLLGCLL
jgi:DNA-binding HxlR family transcriptional regulator